MCLDVKQVPFTFSSLPIDDVGCQSSLIIRLCETCHESDVSLFKYWAIYYSMYGTKLCSMHQSRCHHQGLCTAVSWCLCWMGISVTAFHRDWNHSSFLKENSLLPLLGVVHSHISLHVQDLLVSENLCLVLAPHNSTGWNVKDWQCLHGRVLILMLNHFGRQKCGFW